MSDKIIQISEDFWNIRGTFKLFGFLNIGTQSSLVKCANGDFVMLDAYQLNENIKAKVNELTEQGKKLVAIINLHPFHTIHVEALHKQFPSAKLFGTSRHLEVLPSLPWENELTESNEFAERFADDFEFSIPKGVDFISSNENLHFSSVLAYHKHSKTIHSDDTLMYLRLPGILGWIKKPKVSFHFTLSKTLEQRAGAASEFRYWASQLVQQWGDAKNLCAAHSQYLIDPQTESIADSILIALNNVEKVLQAHEEKFG